MKFRSVSRKTYTHRMCEGVKVNVAVDKKNWHWRSAAGTSISEVV